MTNSFLSLILLCVLASITTSVARYVLVCEVARYALMGEVVGLLSDLSSIGVLGLL